VTGDAVTVTKLKAEFARHAVSWDDFDEVLRYINEHKQDLAIDIRRALIGMAIIAYARPFGENYPGRRKQSAPKVDISLFGLCADHPRFMLLHRRLLTLHGNVIAHSSFDWKPARWVPRNDSCTMSEVGQFDVLAEQIDLGCFKAMLSYLQYQCGERCTQISAKLRALGVRDAPAITHDGQVVTRIRFPLKEFIER